MRRTTQFAIGLLLVVVVLGAAVVIFKPEIAPTYAYYDLIGRWAAPLPAEIENYVLQSGEDFCGRGHDSECGGYRIVKGKTLATTGGTNGWCIDYVVLRRNLGRTGDILYWSYVPQAMVVLQPSAGPLDSFPVEDCRSTMVQ